MTVKQLKDIIADLPDDLEVWTPAPFGWQQIDMVSVEELHDGPDYPVCLIEAEWS